MKNIKKIICGVLCLAMLLGTVAFADEVAPTNDAEKTTVQSEQVETTVAEESKDEIAENVETVAPTEVVEEPKESETSVKPVETTGEVAPVTEDNSGEVATPEENTTNNEVQEPVVPASDEITVKVNGQTVVFEDVKPQILDGRTLVPFRKVGDAMNAAVAWRGTDRTAHYFRNGISVMLTIGQSQMEVREYEMGEKFVYTTEAKVSPIDPDQPSVIARTIDDRTMIPIRATAEALGAKVDWDDATKTVLITIPAYTLKLADKDAAALIENWNYKPATELKTGSVDVRVYGNFQGADSALGNDVTLTIDGKTQTTANGGVASFSEVKAGTYKLTVSNIPEGYVVSDGFSYDVTVVAGEKANISIPLLKAEKEEVKEDNKTEEKTDDKSDATETKVEEKTEDKTENKTK